MTDQTTVVPTTEATVTETLLRLETKIDAVMTALETRPTHEQMAVAIDTKTTALQDHIENMVSSHPTLEQVQVIADNTIRPVIATVDKLVNALSRSSEVHDQSMQRIERLYEIAVANTAAVKSQKQDINSLEDTDRDHDVHIATLQANAKVQNTNLNAVSKTLDGKGGLLMQTQTMHATVVTVQGDLEQMKPTIDELDKHRARQVLREEKARAFIQSRTGLALAAGGFGTVFGDWLGLIDIDSFGEVIGLAIKLLI